MKNKILITSLSLLLCLLFLPSVAFGNFTHFQAKVNNIPIYDVHKGIINKKPIGSLKKNQPYKIISEYKPNFWRIQFGNEFGYIDHDDVTLTKSNDRPSLLKNSNHFLLTKETILVYEKKSIRSKAIGVINKNLRYPFVSKTDNWYEVHFAGKKGYIHQKGTEIDNGIPVLVYHHLLKDNENKNFRDSSSVLSVENFSEQMKWLSENNYITLSMDDLYRYLNKELNPPAKSVVITFDDALQSNYLYAYPILKKYGFIATEFTVSSRLHDIKRVFNPDKIQTMSNSEMNEIKDVFAFENHSHDLHFIKQGKGATVSSDFETVKNDYNQNKEILHSNYVAYPYGQYNATTIKAMESIGIKLAFTIKPGKVKPGDKPYELNRTGIKPTTSIKEFEQFVSN